MNNRKVNFTVEVLPSRETNEISEDVRVTDLVTNCILRMSHFSTIYLLTPNLFSYLAPHRSIVL